ncbi:Protein PucC [Thermoflexales bacterium]|nr:Protein PucC [Thermoflexales bacterium]
MTQSNSSHFSLRRSLKIGSFNLGSALVDILTASVWNRVMITDLGAGATPVSILLALRYLLAPLSIWAGYRSDTRPMGGLRRTPYIWLGRALMLLAVFLLPISLSQLSVDLGNSMGWVLALLIFIAYGAGTAISGGPFLALIHDRTPVAKRGLAMSIAQTLLLLGFAISPIVFGRLLPTYSPEQFQTLAILTGLAAALFWFFAIFREDRTVTVSEIDQHVKRPPLGQLLKRLWADRRARRFAIFLSLGAIASFAQDAVLEPFGGDVFAMNVEQTTRFSAYFGTGVLLLMIITAGVTRRQRPEQQTRPAVIGLSVMVVGLVLLALGGLATLRWLIIPALLVFGAGFGVYTIGGVSLLMAMTTEKEAGVYLGLWTMIQLVSRGVGIGLGGIVRDIGLALTGSPAVAYSSVFLLEAMGLAVCITLVRRLDVAGFARQQPGGELAAGYVLAD